MIAQQVRAELSPEWARLKSLRLYRHRLRDKNKYRKLDTTQLLASGNKFQDQVDFLEDSLRNMMRRNDLDVFLKDGLLDAAETDRAQGYLESLCITMERIVNTDLSRPSSSVLGRQHTPGKYSKLDTLLDILAETDWQFEMVSGTGHRLFRTTTPETDKKETEKFNLYFNRLTQPSIDEYMMPNDDLPDKDSLISSRRNELIRALKGVAALLSRLRNSSRCQEHHEVLLQLSEWDTAAPGALYQGSCLELFLSTCGISSRWQESQLSNLLSVDQCVWQITDQICDYIRDAFKSRNRLHLAISDCDIFVRDSDDEDDTPLRCGIGNQPSKTLKQLLQYGAFDPSGYQIFRSGTTRFSRVEKRALAAALVSSLALSLDSGSMIKCWDSEAVYFLSDSDGKQIQTLPYALCMHQYLQSLETSTAQALGPISEDTIFPLLARLLMEIEVGRQLDQIPLESVDNDRSRSPTLEDLISDQIGRDLDNQQASYFYAIYECLKFREKCQDKANRMRKIGTKEERLSIARKVIRTKIIEKIRRSAHPVPSRKRPSSTLGNREKSNFTFPEISSGSGHLGLSSDSILQHRYTPRTRPGSEGYNKRARFVRFAEAEHQVELVETIRSDLIDDNIDACELFGPEDEQHTPEPLREEARLWLTGFKALRKRFNIGRGKGKRLKIAILDTGIDSNLEELKDDSRIICKKSFVGDDTIDTSGHGTQIAGIILDLTTNADIYIGKIMSSRHCQERHQIVQALHHARTDWEVDIISLSFGFRRTGGLDKVHQEIRNCLRQGIVVFGSASNDGGNKPRTYPGNYKGVICIHSATGAGNKSTFNPTPEPKTSRKNNFSVVGDCIESAWPSQGLEAIDVSVKKYVSGTSFATPVAVSIAAFMIGYISKHMAEYDWNIEPCSPEGMQMIFHMMSEKNKRDGYDWISPQWYFGYFGEDCIKQDLKRELRGYIKGSISVHALEID